jgi:murein DD-endopeptidase MepM/ murein hydrolase activator NlpD
MVHAATLFKRCADAVRRTGLVSVVDEFVCVTLRKPRVTFVMKSAALSAVIVAVSVGYSVNSPSGFAKNAVETAANTVTDLPVQEAPQIAVAPPPPQNLKRLVTVRAGDTFMKLMTGVSVSRSDANNAIQAMRKIYNPRDIRPGQTLTAHFTPADESGQERQFLGLSFSLSADQTVGVSRTDKGTFEANLVERELDHRVANLGGSIDTSLYTGARRAGLPSSVIVDLIRLFSWDVDFQRDIRPGDSFNVLVERAHLKTGEVARWGDVLYADMTVAGKTQRYFRFESKDRRGRKRVDYYNEKGHSARKPLLKTPVDGARLSSGFGRRRHPILGYTKMHRGVDFAAPRGTPIYAAGNGTVASVGRKGGYGRYIRIRHNGQYSTAYGHLLRYARGMKRGKRVKQGEIIGYVGSSGRSTGPHLHYEVLIGGRQVNPLRVRLPAGRRLKGQELASFRAVRTYLDRRLASIPKGTVITQTDIKSDPSGQQQPSQN